MQRQNLKFFVVICAFLVLDLPRICIAKHHHRQGSATTRGPAPTQAPPPQPSQGPNSDAAKLSYGNQGPESHAPPAAAPPGWNTNQNHAPPPPYSPNPPSYQPQPGYHQPGAGPAPAPQPVIINHVQQPQSSGGGLGVGSGLAIGT